MEEKTKIPIPLVVFILGQRCTLRCRDCGNFTPYLPQTFYDLESIWDDFTKLLSVADLARCQIQGGEPLIHPEFIELCRRLRILRPGQVYFATNGTRLLSSGQIEALRAIDASLRISNYSVTGQRAQELQRQCEQEGVRSELFQFALGDGKWLNMGGASQPRGDDEEARSRFVECPFRGCLTLEDGIIGRCSRATVAHHTQKFSPTPGDFVTIRQLAAEQLHDVLGEYLGRPSPMEACRYCLGNQGERISPAIQMQRKHTKRSVSDNLATGGQERP
jgi:hypothetical protein